MKRFLLAVFLLIMWAGSCAWLYFCQGFYLDFMRQGDVHAPFCVQDKKILLEQKDGSVAPLKIRGVDLLSSVPGEYASAFPADEEDYLRWLEQIADMGANTVRVYSIMDEDFYNALYAFNTGNRKPLYLIQGIQTETDGGYHDAYHWDFMGALLENGVDAVDIVHGRKIFLPSGKSDGGRYLNDVSPWTIGYLLGDTWNPDTIAYTDNSAVHTGVYAGEYFSTAANATPFEAMLAQVMDKIFAYESNKYQSQRLIAFANSPNTDFLVYEDSYARQLNKYVCLDAEHILPTEQVRSGCFAAYTLYRFGDGFADYLADEQRTRLSPLPEHVNTARSYNGYLDLLSAYHTMPLVASYGFSSARGATDMNQPPMTEKEQGEALISVWRDACAADWSGVCISAWQDTWERRTWNTAFAQELSRNALWHDLQTAAENSGLMAFVPGSQPVCVLDGNISEWAEDTPILTGENGVKLYLRHDHEGLYFMLQGERVNPEIPLYLPIDVTDELGSVRCRKPALTFDRAADFLLCLNGKENTHLLVQERYDALRENFGYEIEGENPFLSLPKADSSLFVPIGMALNNATLLDYSNELSVEQTRQLQALGVWETGSLVHGNGNPKSANYCSLTDFSFGESCVEIRIPWLLLNVSDPTSMQVHRDYYNHYGVESAPVHAFWLGVGDGSGEIVMTEVNTQKWNRKLKWHERLKESYHVVQTHWKS